MRNHKKLLPLLLITSRIFHYPIPILSLTYYYFLFTTWLSFFSRALRSASFLNSYLNACIMSSSTLESFLNIISMNSLKSMAPLEFLSTFLIISSSSFLLGFKPWFLMTLPNSSTVISPKNRNSTALSTPCVKQMITYLAVAWWVIQYFYLKFDCCEILTILSLPIVTVEQLAFWSLKAQVETMECKHFTFSV